MNSAFQQTGALPVIIETTAGNTHSLTTTAGQKVIVWATGTATPDAAGEVPITFTLKYNGVTKDTKIVSTIGATRYTPFTLMYTETPGAGTQNITVEKDIGTFYNVVIMVMKV